MLPREHIKVFFIKLYLLYKYTKVYEGTLEVEAFYEFSLSLAKQYFFNILENSLDKKFISYKILFWVCLSPKLTIAGFQGILMKILVCIKENVMDRIRYTAL